MTISKFFFIDLEKRTEERYDLGKFMKWEGDNFDPLTSNILFEIKNLPVGGRYTIRGEEGRPDLLSYNIYGDTQYWWILMLYNGFNDISEILSGNEMQFPLVQDLESYYFSLKANQTRVDET